MFFTNWINKKSDTQFTASVEIDGEKHQFPVSEKQTVLEAALQFGIPMPFSCQVGSCGECRCQLVSGEVKTIGDLGYMFDSDELAKGMTLACQAKPRKNLEIRFCAQEKIPARITSIQKLDEKIYSICVVAEGFFEAKIGQYLAIENHLGVKRSYSIVALKYLENQVHIDFHVAIRSPGEMSAWWLSACSLLNKEARLPSVTLGAAQGNFSVVGKATHIVAITGGSGLGVTCALIDEHLAQNKDAHATIYAVSRNVHSGYFTNQIDILVRRYAERISSKIIDGESYFSTHSLKELNEHKQFLASESVCGLLCGSSELVRIGKLEMVRFGIDKDRVSYDEFA